MSYCSLGIGLEYLPDSRDNLVDARRGRCDSSLHRCTEKLNATRKLELPRSPPFPLPRSSESSLSASNNIGRVHGEKD
jgi:hypothetical protein